MQAAIRKMTDGSVALKLDADAARAVFAAFSRRAFPRGDLAARPDSQRKNWSATTRRRPDEVNHADDLCRARRKKKSPAVCELFSLRDLPEGESIMVRTNGAFVAGYELRASLGTSPTDGDRNQTKAMLEALFRSVPDVSMRIQFRYEISERLGDCSTTTSTTARQSAGGDGARCAPSADVGARRSKPATSSRTGYRSTTSGTRAFMPSSITRPNRIASWAASR